MVTDYLFHGFRTVFGLYLCPFSKSWDEKLSQLLDKGTVLYVTDYTIVILTATEVVEIWIGNQWYSFGHLYRIDSKYVPETIQSRPRFRTMRRLYAVVKDHIVKGVQPCP
ncbi:TPA: hypothetical protein ACXZT8_000287 [Salmonella enterica]|uniref:Uncharacterized protein n=1 Tax=Salmonella enterica subsp. enterica serovar Eastbourne TaxID=486993 RepID=A0A702B4Z9_SALET|nr:hypothetical protein [Salmonella enterica subsp. enterica serovar Eastbourne]ECA1898072.1 hypothetical protein [Salmonella enterica subsp. enterica serovar Eastbourne]HAC6674879.1 hypothetical protein [Salmonella enterica subsp. enterica serovar Eastbourne]HAE5115428.1 hypothetical protein [Salmonella enterica subsp. enterica serovar Eastbourne]HAE8026531.1 hypothetical protein [Salmonella enterica subsp. enterica serovar Eastbourne]